MVLVAVGCADFRLGGVASLSGVVVGTLRGAAGADFRPGRVVVECGGGGLCWWLSVVLISGSGAWRR
ncbi:MAG: hypothetical protein OXD37_01560 [Acidimicrobiaceae bacterium]|nr:hypothetical protein [Acidimicrobiaceae bacterium]